MSEYQTKQNDTEQDDNSASSEHEKQSALSSSQEERTVAKSLGPSALMVFEIIRREGTEELSRPGVSLFWSGIAGGLALSFSLAMPGMIVSATQEGTLQTLLKPLGYVIGFLIIVFGRLQLFTENTITAVLPLAANFTRKTLGQVFRLNAVVITANLTGALIAATVISFTPVVQPEHLDGILEVARKAYEKSFWEALALGIPAGFLVAAMVWMLPAARGSEFLVVTAVIYVLALGGFAHVIVGTVEGGVLFWHGEVGAFEALGGFVIPALIGNIIGGTALFAVLAYAQIRDEMRRHAVPDRV